MKFNKFHMVLIGIAALLIASISAAGFLYRTGFENEGLLVRVGGASNEEGFRDSRQCDKCGISKSRCGCGNTCKGCGNSMNSCGCGKKCGSCGNAMKKCGCSSVSPSPSSMPGMPGMPATVAPCPRVMEPDLSKYILKSQIPSCNRSPMPEMSNYMLKTECPPVPDLSKYVLKSSIPKPQPVIIDNSKCKTESGECPPCPRPRCPVVKCPAPTKCPPPAPCPRPVCPPTVVKCKSEESTQPTVRPFLAPLNMQSFGSS